MRANALFLTLGCLMAACISSNPEVDTDLDVTAPSEAPDAVAPDAVAPDAVLVHGRPVVFPAVESEDAEVDAELPNDARLTDTLPCPETRGVLFDPAAPAPAVDGCEAQCRRLAHCASHTWDDGSDRCRCLEDADENAILQACTATCATVRGPNLYYALFDTIVCSELVPAVEREFASFARQCGGAP